MSTKKVRCNICGGTGENAAFVGGKKVTSPCGGCLGTGFQTVQTTSTSSGSGSGCMLFFLISLILGITFTVVKYFS